MPKERHLIFFAEVAPRVQHRRMLCIIIPFRVQEHFDRHKQLRSLVQRLREGVRCAHSVLVVEQCEDDQLFNRGKLLNVGFRLLPSDCSTCIFHDVDLLPCDRLLAHYTEAPGVCHLGARWGRYSNNPRYFGGVLRMDVASFRDVNGFPNTYWGWGGEDDALFKRVQGIGLPITVPRSGEYRDLEGVGLRDKLRILREGNLKCMTKWEQLEEDPRCWRVNGISSVDYHVQRSAQENGYMCYTVDIRYPLAENITFMRRKSPHGKKRKQRHAEGE